MKRALFAACLLVACGDSDGSGGAGGGVAGGDFARYDVSFSELESWTMSGASFGSVFVREADGRVFAAGIGQTAAKEQRFIVSYLDPPTSLSAVSFSAPLELALRLSDLVPDGSGGVFLAGNVLIQGNLPRQQPVLMHWDAAGQLAWSKIYAPTDPQYFNLPNVAGTTPEVQLGGVINGKLPVAAANAVVVVDSDGQVHATFKLEDQTTFHQVLSDADGFTVFAARYEAFQLLRFDWDATLLWAKEATAAVPSGSLASLYTPRRRADGSIVLPYVVRDGLTAKYLGGALVLDADYALTDNFSYDITGTYHYSEDIALDGTYRFQAIPIADDLVLTQVLAHLPYPDSRDIGFGLALPIDGSADGSAYVNGEGMAALPDGRVVSLGIGLGIGGLGSKCARMAVELDAAPKVQTGIEPVPPFDTPLTLTSSPFELTASDFALTVAPLTPTVNPAASNVWCQ